MSQAKPVTIMRPEPVIAGWLESAIRAYVQSDNDLLRAELRAEAIILIWVLDKDLTWFQARDYFEDKVADLEANEPEGEDVDED